MGNTADYSTYNADDFLEDSYFLAWMREEDAAIIQWWLQWLEANPQKASAIKEAKEKFKLLTSFRKFPPDEQAASEVWEQINSSTGYHTIIPHRRVIFYQRRWFWAAASVLILLTASLLYFHKTTVQREEITINAINSIQTTTLEDGTVITLNKNSTLSYYKPELREVWVKGQAVFEVKKQHTPDNKLTPFLVHAGNMLVTVTGTVFSITNNNNETNVVLSEGGVNASAGNKTIQLLPGEKLEYTGSKLEKTKVNPQLFSAWKDGEFHFDNTSLTELKEVIKDSYGATLIIKQENRIKHHLVSGIITAESREKFLQTLAVLLNVDINAKDSTILMQPK